MSKLWCPELYRRAWYFAAEAHQDQRYSGARQGVHVPYITHLGSVAMELGVALMQEQEPKSADSDTNLDTFDIDLAMQCALLHDTLEDTPVSYELLVSTFGHAVANGVLALSKDASQGSKWAQMLDSLQRIRQQPKEIWMVKMADRIVNLYDKSFDWKPDKIAAYCQESYVIYEQLASANDYLAERLMGKIKNYKLQNGL